MNDKKPDDAITDKKPLPKDSLKRIIKMMEYVEEHDEEKKEGDMTEEFGEVDYNLFSRYCLGGTDYYAYTVTGSDKMKLTQNGLRKLYELRRIAADEKRLVLTNWIAFLLVLITAVQALFLALQWFGI